MGHHGPIDKFLVTQISLSPGTRDGFLSLLFTLTVLRPFASRSQFFLSPPQQDSGQMSNLQQAPLVGTASVNSATQRTDGHTSSSTLAPALSLPTQVVQNYQPYATISPYVAIVGQSTSDSNAGQASNAEQIFSMGRPALMPVAIPTSTNSLSPSAPSSNPAYADQNQQATQTITATSEKPFTSNPTSQPQPAVTGEVVETALNVVNTTSIEVFSETATLTNGFAAAATAQTATDVITERITGSSSPPPSYTAVGSLSAAEASNLSAAAASSISAVATSSLSAATASSTSTSASDADESSSAPVSHLPLVIIGSVIGGFVAIAAISAIVGWLLRWRARRRGNYGHDLPWVDEPIFVGDDSKFKPESSPVIHGDSGTSWGNAAASMGMYESQHNASQGIGRASYCGGDRGERKESRTLQYQGTPYPRHNFFPPPGIPQPTPPGQARMSLYGGVADNSQLSYPYYASPQPLSQQDYATSPTNISPITPQAQNLAVTNFAPGDMSHSTTMHTRKSASSPHQQTATRIFLDTPQPPSTAAPPSPWAPLDVPSRRSTSSSSSSSTRSAKRSRDAPRTSLPNPSEFADTDVPERESWASALRANFYAALGGLGGAVSVATAAATPRVIDDEEKLTPAVPARAMTRRSIPQHQQRKRSSRPQIARGETSASDPSVYEDDENETKSGRRTSTQSNRLYSNVRRHSREEAAQAQLRLDPLRRANSDSDGSSSGWTTDRGEVPDGGTPPNGLAGERRVSGAETGRGGESRA